jgi:hypothetical protein
MGEPRDAPPSEAQERRYLVWARQQMEWLEEHPEIGYQHSVDVTIPLLLAVHSRLERLYNLLDDRLPCPPEPQDAVPCDPIWDYIAEQGREENAC